MTDLALSKEFMEIVSRFLETRDGKGAHEDEIQVVYDEWHRYKVQQTLWENLDKFTFDVEDGEVLWSVVR